MKLIIDIPKGIYDNLMDDQMPSVEEIQVICIDIMNGTLFDEIKADFENYRAEQDKSKTFHFLRMKMCDDFAEIIDKYRGKERE